MNTQTDDDQPVAAPQPLVRVTRDPLVMQGKACIRGMRVTVGMIVGQIGAGRSGDSGPSVIQIRAGDTSP